jgi:hypothetical protein
MRSLSAKTRSKRSKNETKTIGGPSREVTANEVFEDLLLLFQRLGIDLTEDSIGNRKLRSKFNGSHTLYPYTAAIGELFTAWHQKPNYVDERGNPARLKILGRSPSFKALAQTMVPKVDQSYLLSELERLGAISIEEPGYVSLHMRSVPMYEDKRLAAQHTLSILRGFIRTLRHNLESAASNSDQLFHRIAWSDDFDAEEVSALKARIKRHGQSFLESFDDWIGRKSVSKSANRTAKKKRTQVTIGLYISLEKPPRARR